LSARLTRLSDCFSVGGVGQMRTCRVPPGPRVSIVTLGPPAIAGRSGDWIFWLAKSPPPRTTTSTPSGTSTVIVPNRL
jgi:hypothetical protein